MAAGDLTTLPTALNWLGLSSDVGGTIARLISAVSAQAQQFVSFQFASQSHDRFVDGKGTRAITLPDRPITAVSLVELIGRPVPARIGSTPGYTFDKTRIMVDAPYEFSRGFSTARVMYTAGYATIPADVEQAVLIWLKATYDAKDIGGNVTEYRAGDHQVKFSHATPVGGGFIAPMPVQTYAILLPYQRVTPV